MADPASNVANRFFIKIYDSAHAGLMNEAPPAQRFNFEAAVPVDFFPMILGNDPPAPAGLEDAVGPIAKEAKSDYFQNTTTPTTDAEHRGEEGPLSGGFSGLNKKSVDFGESSFSRSGADAVGSASESSYDIHVGSMEYTEVGHASGHQLSSSTDRIESGVSKPPESNPVLFRPGMVERSVDVKDRRQPAALSQDHGNRGIGPGGLDNDRAGLPPPPPSPLDTTQPTTASVKAGDAAEIETASAAQKGQTASASEPGNRSPEKRRPTAIDTGGMKISDDHHPGAPTTGRKGANRFNRPPSSFSDPATSQQGRSAQMPRPRGNAQGRPAAAEVAESPITASSATKTGADNGEFQRRGLPGTEIQHSDKTARPPFFEAGTVVNVAHTRRQPRKIPLIVHTETDGPPMPLSPAGSQPLDRFKPQPSPQPRMPPGDPQVQIGHIDVIVHTPQTAPKSDSKTSSGLPGFASRYYLKGL